MAMPRAGRMVGGAVAAFVMAAGAAATLSCTAAPRLPERAPGLEEARESAAGMLAREYPGWATGIAPVPGRVVGLLMPAESRWGRSLEWIGESLVRNRGAYAGMDPARVRSYALYAQGVSPRLLWFAEAGAAGRPADREVRTLTGEVRAYAADLLGPGGRNAWGLGAEAHIAALEVSGGAGNARWPRYELVATGVEPLEGRPGYPVSAADLLDRARAAFDDFVASEATRVAALLEAQSALAGEPARTPPREDVVDALFPWWDDDRRRLVVLFHRSVLRVDEYSIPCMFVYEGMPPERKSMTVRQGYGVELGQKLELDADGVLVALRSFEPAPFRVSSGVPEPPPTATGRTPKEWPVVCPGSPGAARSVPPGAFRSPRAR